MPVTLVNPYLTLAELKDELKIAQSDVSKDDVLKTAINLASGWVDEYRGRDYFGHDHRGAGIAGVTPAGGSPLVIDKFSDAVFGAQLFIPFGEVREIYALTENGTALTKGTNFTYREAPMAKQRLIWRLGTDWQVGEPPTNVISIRGKFGGNQWKKLDPIISYTPAGSGIQAAGFTMTNTNPAKNNDLIYYRVQLSGANVNVNFYSNAGLTQLIANPSDVITPPANNVPIFEQGGSGWSGSFNYGTFLGNQTGSIQLRNDVLDSSIVPTDLPGFINLAAKLVAAAISGHNRKEVPGLDGTRMEIQDNKIPKTVFDLLGRRAVIL